jgi:hypothetical protein
MLLALNATLYVFAFGLAVTSLRTVPPSAGLPGRVARGTLIGAGGPTIAAAVGFGFAGLWFESALAGSAALVVIGVCMWLGLSCLPQQDPAEDEEDEDDDGGSLFRPPAPEPTRPEGGPSDDLWSDFDAARAGWQRERERSSV